MSRHSFARLRQLLNRQPNTGFTLTEILISLLIAGIVMSGLMYLVVELLRIDRRELALEQVQRDMQRAVDYIADDVREAVYVYTDPTRIAAELRANGGNLPAGTPVLAFWRPDFIAENLIPPSSACSTVAAGARGRCSALSARRATYTLVVYLQRDRADVWEGDSHLIRYELKQYPNGNPGTTFDQVSGYKDPIVDSAGVSSTTGEGEANFINWTANGPARGTRAVLVDYLDAAQLTGTPADCADPNLAGDGAYTLSPSTATSTSSFIACIRDPEITNTTSLSLAARASGRTFRAGQDVLLFVRGDAEGVASDFLQPASENSRLPRLQTQVLVRGIINKDQID